MDQRSDTMARGLTLKYLLALGLLAGLALANHLILGNQIAASRSVAEVVNLSGRQRLLLQRSALLAQELVMAESGNSRQKLRMELLAALEPMEHTHYGLIRKDSKVPPPQSVQDIYFNSPWLLDTEVRNFIAQLRSLMEIPDAELELDNPHVRYLRQTAASPRLAEGLNAVVAAYQQEAEAKTDRLRNLAVWSLGSTAVVLAISGWLVFRPMVHQVKTDMEALGQLNDTLEQRVAERTALAEHRAEALALSEGALRDQSRMLQSILDNMGDGVVVADKGGFRLFNPKAREIFHIGAGDDVPDVWEPEWTKRFGVELYLPERETAYPADQWPLLRAARGESLDRAEVVLRHGATSRSAWLSITARPLLNGEGLVCGAVAVVRDITARKDAEKRLRDAERLAAIGQMVAGVAHESRNALQQIQACCGMLQWKLNGDAATADLVGDIEKAQQRLARLFDDLRGYAAPMKLEPSRRDVREILAETWAGLEPRRNGRDASLRQESFVADTRCTVDHLGIEQVYRNILENALAACSDPVVIDVRFTRATLDGKEALAISICDNGPGLSDEQRENIFQPFYSTKSRGSGLGMAISRRMVEAHGGRITVGDLSGPGTEILIQLPRGER